LNAPLFRGIAESKAVVRGTWGAKAVAGLEPQAGDIVIEKMRMNAFHGTKLETILQGYGIDSLVIHRGLDQLLHRTHRPARRPNAGYEIVVATDGTSTIDDACRMPE